MTFLGSHRRKYRWPTVVAAAAVLATGAGVAVASSVSASPVAAPAAAHRAASAASAASAARVVGSGERITVAGYRLWLTSAGVHVATRKPAGGIYPANVLRVAGVRSGKVTEMASGNRSGALWTGIYRGPVSSATKVTLTFGSRTLRTTVVSLAGKSGWGAFYVFDAKAEADAKPTVTVETR